MVSSRTPGGATLADLLAIPEGQRRHEVIDGVLVEKQAASGAHGKAQGRLNAKLYPYDRRPGGRSPGGWHFLTEVEVELAPNQIVRPDVAGWRRERMPTVPREVPIHVRPDWVCEILSPTNATNDTIRKKRAYHAAGVAHYWLLDPIEQGLSVLRRTPEGYLEVLNALSGERVHAEPFDEIELEVGVLFGEDETD